MRAQTAVFLAAASLVPLCFTAACQVTDYPVIFDSRGPYSNNVLTGQYEPAYIVPSGDVVSIWSDGSDEIYSVVQQDWLGDQWIKTYNNFDPTASILFLDQTYCDPLLLSDCPLATSWNPNLPNCRYPGEPQPCDDSFDNQYASECSGARSMCLELSVSSRIGECGSGLWSDKQGFASEFAQLSRATFRNRPAYALPINAQAMSVQLTARDGASAAMPIFGQYTAYLDDNLRFMTQVSPNVRYQVRWLQNWTRTHGSETDIVLTYGSFQAPFRVAFSNLDAVLDRL